MVWNEKEADNTHTQAIVCVFAKIEDEREQIESESEKLRVQDRKLRKRKHQSVADRRLAAARASRRRLVAEDDIISSISVLKLQIFCCTLEVSLAHDSDEEPLSGLNSSEWSITFLICEQKLQAMQDSMNKEHDSLCPGHDVPVTEPRGIYWGGTNPVAK
ncbi:hypothetical protein L1887_23391 [Cichorium endivia]|nr:hypothetical protein L1887_23391 [Cichorium endivia]